MLQFNTYKQPSDFIHLIAKNHRMLRKRMGISQTEMSKRSGVSLGSIKRFESSGKISLESLLKLAAVLNRLEDFEEIFLPKEGPDIDALFSDKMRKS